MVSKRKSTETKEPETGTKKESVNHLKRLSVNRLVFYTLDSGAIRPALIVHIWNPDGLVNLQVFPDSDTDGTTNDHMPVPMWKTSVPYDEEDTHAGTWRYTHEAQL